MKLPMPGTPKAEPAPGPPPVDSSPGELQPGPSRIVGAGAFALTPSPGNQWAAIFVPSNEVIVPSSALAEGAQAKAVASAATDPSPPGPRLLMRARPYKRGGSPAPVAATRSADDAGAIIEPPRAVSSVGRAP